MSGQENMLVIDHAYFFCSFYLLYPVVLDDIISRQELRNFSGTTQYFLFIAIQIYPQQGTLFSSLSGNNYSWMQVTEGIYF